MKKLTLLLVIVLLSCKGDEKSKKENPTNKDIIEVDDTISSTQSEKDPIEVTTPFFTGKTINVEALNGTIDLNMDISTMNISDLRILRNAFAAKQGYCFMKADLRAIFNTTSWYSNKMEDRYWQEEDGNEVPPITHTNEEKVFIEKIKKREQELKSSNFPENNEPSLVNINNIVNLFQLEEVNPKLMDKLNQNGFAIVPNTNIQLFHVYEQNDYQQFPNFVTTDMYMQLFHMFFSFILRTTEEEKFIPLLAEICQAMMTDMNQINMTASDESVKEIAKYNATYYAIAYTALTNKRVDVPIGYENHYVDELSLISDARDKPSVFLDYDSVFFPYSLFKPRGHYTRTDELKRYFKAMMWLQTAPFCLDNDLHLKRAIMNSSILADSPNFGEKTLKKYTAIMEPINFIIGQPDNVSFLDLAQLIKRDNYDLNELLKNQGSLDKFKNKIKEIADAQNLIKPKEPYSCIDKINFIPQRYLADNEILQELVDVDSKTTKRGIPKGLDVMAAFGSESAENILINEIKEGDNWGKYPQRLSDLKNKMKTEVNWDATLYNKWIESLLELQKPNKNYPYFMQTPQWNKKNLNSSLASWAELKHDAILYAEQPMAAECGSGGPPDPYTVGYVEPNIAYWNSVIDLIDLTKDVFDRNELTTSSISRIIPSIRENAEFLLSASQKELAGESLSENEYEQIEKIGSTFEWLTLDLVKEKGQYLNGWDNVTGPDKSIAVVADIYTGNSSNNPDKKILHVATGNVNDIYVVVEIEGYLYLTKGAVFSYHEFGIPLGNRLTDEEWQEMLEKNEAPEIPEWVKEIIVPIDVPKSNEKIFYSSGC